MLMKLGLSLLAAAMLAFAAAASAAAPNATVVIRHQQHGCHTWSINGGAWKATQKLAVRRGATMTVIDNDVMPHQLVQKTGPAVRYTGRRLMGHMGASEKVTFLKAGTYSFLTRAGEDYPGMDGVQTIGEDNVLRLTVTVS
jgi:plastocyanin